MCQDFKKTIIENISVTPIITKYPILNRISESATFRGKRAYYGQLPTQAILFVCLLLTRVFNGIKEKNQIGQWW